MARTAVAEPTAPLTLRWQAPAGCPQQAEVKERIHALTGTMRPAATSLQAEGTITQTDSTHFHLKLVTRSGGLVGERSLDASSCENLTGAAAVSLALLMRSAEPLSADDLAGKPSPAAPIAGATAGGSAETAGATTTTSATPPTKSDQANSTPKPSSAASSASAARKAEAKDAPDETDAPPSEIIQRPIRPAPRQWRVLAELPLAVMSVGLLPKPSWGLAFAGGASLESWRLLLGGSAWLRQSVTGAPDADYGADIDRFTGTFKACRALNRAKFEVAPCFALSLEHISARGTGTGVAARSEQATWLAVGAGVQGRLSLTGWLSLLLAADAQIETGRPVISIEGAGQVKQLGSAAFTATVGPEWIL